MEIEEKLEVIDASKLSAFQFCPYSYYLDSMIEENRIPMSGYVAEEAWLRIAFKKLIPDERYVGEKFKHIEDLLPHELQNYLVYKSPDSFAKGMFGLWKEHVIDNKGKIHDREIVWSYRNQWWKAANEIKRACFNYYKHATEKGLPILDYIDKKLAFYFEGKQYEVRFGEIRKGGVVGKQDIKKRNQKELDKDWEITLQLLAFSQLVRDYEAYRWKFDIPSKQWEGILLPELRFVYYNLLDDEEYETKRTDADLESMKEIITSTKKLIEQCYREKFPPNHRNCYTCKYNVLGLDNKPICRETTNKVAKPMELWENE